MSCFFIRSSKNKSLFKRYAVQCKTKMRLERLWLLLSLQLVLMAVDAIGRTKKDHRHLLMRKLITGGKRSGKNSEESVAFLWRMIDIILIGLN